MTEKKIDDKSSILRVIKRTVREYNKYRAPEARAKLVSVDRDRIEILFDGSFCETCGVNDWIDDFRYMLKRHNIDSVIESIEEIDEYRRRSVFRISVPKKTRSK
ncbi:MAG: hypothetical protein ABWJ42_06445 [Sulfolobales archaeon]